VDWVELKISRTQTIDGILIVYEKSADQVVEALSLIKTFDPLRYARLRRDIKRIWVRVIGAGMANFEWTTWTCNLDPRFMKDRSAAATACSIIHEATHARLCRLGIGYDEKLRTRVEQACFRRELAFASKLPDGSDARRYAECALFAPPDFSDAGMQERSYTEAREALLHLGAPTWITKLIISFVRWRHARGKPASKS
jgi:hypothetical protein